MTLSTLRADVLAYALAALAVVAITLLAALGQDVPEVLVTVALVAAGAGAGGAVPRPSSSTPTSNPAGAS